MAISNKVTVTIVTIASIISIGALTINLSNNNSKCDTQVELSCSEKINRNGTISSAYGAMNIYRRKKGFVETLSNGTPVTVICRLDFNGEYYYRIRYVNGKGESVVGLVATFGVTLK